MVLKQVRQMQPRPLSFLGVFQKQFSFQTMSYGSDLDSSPTCTAAGLALSGFSHLILFCPDLLNYIWFVWAGGMEPSPSKTASSLPDKLTRLKSSLTTGQVWPDPRCILALPNFPAASQARESEQAGISITSAYRSSKTTFLPNQVPSVLSHPKITQALSITHGLQSGLQHPLLMLQKFHLSISWDTMIIWSSEPPQITQWPIHQTPRGTCKGNGFI